MNPINTVKTIINLYRLHRSRRRLLALDAHQLKDIGLTRSEAIREGSKWFWEQ